MSQVTETAQDFFKVCRLGTVTVGRNDRVNVFVRIEYKGGRLSICGTEGPYPSGNCAGATGQIDTLLKPSSFNTCAPGWSTETIDKFLRAWERWHLNDMVAGTPRQMRFIRKRQKEANAKSSLHREAPHAYASRMGFQSYYDMECCWLADARILVDKGYSFGSAWLREEVPADVLEWLRGLPDSDVVPAWV